MEKFNQMMFRDTKGRILAVSKSHTLNEAKEIAEKVFGCQVKQDKSYLCAYYGFGKYDDEFINGWWITDQVKQNRVPVWAFRGAE
jgi:hypothetical protein